MGAKLFAAMLLLFAAAPTLALSLAPGDLIVVDQVRSAVFSVNPITGDRVVISGCDACTESAGGGAAMFAPAGLARDASAGLGAPIYITDTITDSILAIDPVTGIRSVVSSAGTGTGTGFSSPFAISVDTSGDLIVVDEGLGSVFRVDPTTGNRTIVSGCPDSTCASLVGTGDAFGLPHDIILDGAGNAVLLDTATEAVVSVDLVSGDRSVISSASVGSGPSFIVPNNIGVDASGNILISDSNFAGLDGFVYRIDPLTGNRSIVASDTVGAGRDLEVPVGLTVDDDGNILVLDFGPGILLSVDPATGDRTIVSSSQTGDGVSWLAPASILVVPIPEPGTLVLVAFGLVPLARRRHTRGTR